MPNTIDQINTATDIIFLTLMLLQQITGKPAEEVLEAIKSEGAKTDALIAKLL